MPGVTTKTATRSGPLASPIPSSGRYFVAGLTQRGRTDKAVRVRSMAEFEALLGTRQTFGAVYDDLRTYFEEGGGEAYVARAIGGAATIGTLMLNDAAGTPAPALKVDALGAGAWSSSVTVEVIVGSTATLRTLRVYYAGALVETFADLDTNAALANALLDSNYVRGTAQAGLIAAPIGPTPLSAGNDDRAAVTAANVITALNNLAGPDLGSGAVATPGYPASTQVAGLMAHALANKRVALAAGAVTESAATIDTIADGLIGNTEAHTAVALLWPWVRIPVAGNIVTAISPEGFAAAKRAEAIGAAGGPWLPPAGRRGQARFVLGPVADVTRAQFETLNDAHVSVIRTIAGTTRLYGWRSLSTDEANYALLSGRDVVNVVAAEAEVRLEDYVFRPIDASGALYSEVAAELIGILDPIRLAGGLYPKLDTEGNQLDPGYSVDVGPSVNTQAVQAANELRANVALRVSPVAEDLVVTIVKVGLAANV